MAFREAARTGLVRSVSKRCWMEVNGGVGREVMAASPWVLAAVVRRSRAMGWGVLV